MSELTTIEASELQEHEAIIERGLKTFVEVGGALLAIRDGRLYRQEWGTFEDYCQSKWGISKTHANRLIDSAEVIANLTPIGVIPLPATESQARPLASLSAEEQPIVWRMSVDTAPNGKVTAAHVQAVVNEYKAPAIIEQPKPITDNTYEQLADDFAGNEDGYDWTKEEETAEEAEIAPSSVIIAPVLDSNEWYTPIEFIEAARRVMGSIDLDPATCLDAQQFIQAKHYYTKENKGEEQEWHGNIWLNPPYANPLPWVSKLTEAFKSGAITSAILLVNTANSPQWSRLLWHGPYTVCLLNKRVQFWRPDRIDTQGTDRDQMIWYMGSDVDKFVEEFSDYGAIR